MKQSFFLYFSFSRTYLLGEGGGRIRRPAGPPPVLPTAATVPTLLPAAVATATTGMEERPQSGLKVATHPQKHPEAMQAITQHPNWHIASGAPQTPGRLP